MERRQKSMQKSIMQNSENKARSICKDLPPKPKNDYELLGKNFLDVHNSYFLKDIEKET